MKRIRRRSAVTLALALLVLFGLGALLARLALRGGRWAAYSANAHVYHNGVLACGTLTDRNGVVLFSARDGEYAYAEEEAVRFASLHAVGDQRGNIGSTALGIFSGDLVGYSPVNGTDGTGGEVRLSLDSRLQAGAWYALNGRPGAVVVMDYETGEILCMVSSPAYDPLYGQRRDAEGMYINRCIGGLFIPGSIFKLVTLTAAAEHIPDLRSRTFTCNGSLELFGETVHCTGVHGEQTVEQALANSCNCAFGSIALELGGQVIRDTAERLGVAGSLPWYGGRTASGRFDVAARGSAPLAWSGIGQYNDLVTPYAMARLCAAVAGGGAVREGVLRAGDTGARSRLMDADTAGFIGDCMNYNVVYAYGKNNFPGLDLAAKTGTAELGDGSTHAWFVGYLRSGPPLAFAVLLEQGGGGLIAAGGVANHVLQLANGYYAS
ncbi:MAG: penicillin-binding protein [Oscillospiraceae bacterium]|nr:penicillin-binding protein [Oscillospiraceae bacterium]